MSFLQLKSNNPKFTYLIKKNPSTPMLIKSIRKGIVFGYYSDNDTVYNIYFRDSDTEISYKNSKEKEFEYINTSKYNSALFVLNVITDFFRDNLRKYDEFELENKYFYNLRIGFIHVSEPKNLLHFNRFFNDIELIYNKITEKNYEIIINTKTSLFKLLNFTILLSLYLAITNEENIFIEDTLIDKIIFSIEIINAPYFIRYLIKRNFLTNKSTYEKYKTLLEKTNLYNIQLTYGDTYFIRADFIKRNLGYNNHIVDVGCGEGRYVISLSKKLEDKYYFAIDNDPEKIQTIERKCKIKQIENVITYNSIKEFYNSEKPDGYFDFIITEVIEHMTIDEASKLMQNIIMFNKFNSLIITTPNKEFNKYYEIEIRHEDHKFEMTKNEFVEWINKIVSKSNKNLKLKIYDLGDIVNDIPTTLCAKILNKEKD